MNASTSNRVAHSGYCVLIRALSGASLKTRYFSGCATFFLDSQAARNAARQLESLIGRGNACRHIIIGNFAVWGVAAKFVVLF